MNTSRAVSQTLVVLLMAFVVMLTSSLVYLRINDDLVHFRWGQHALRQSDSAAAMAHFRQSIDLGFARIDLLAQTAELLRRRGYHEESLVLYRALAAHDPSRPEAQLALAEALAWQGDYPQALAILEQLLVGHPSHGSARLLKARVLSWDGQPDLAIEQYRIYLGELP